MKEILQSLFDAIKAPFGFFADIYQYIKYVLQIIFQGFSGAGEAVQRLTGLPPMLVAILTISLTVGIARLIVNRRN